MTKIIRLICQHTNCRVLAASLLILASILLAGTSFAKIVQNTIDPVAVVSADGRSAVLTGPLACDQKQTADLRVTLTQRTTGANRDRTDSLSLHSQLPSNGKSKCTPKAKKASNPAPPPAVAVARTFVGGGESDDANQWLVNIILASQ